MKKTKTILALILVLVLVVSVKDYIVGPSVPQEINLVDSYQAALDIPDEPVDLIEEKAITTPSTADLLPPAPKEIEEKINMSLVQPIHQAVESQINATDQTQNPVDPEVITNPEMAITIENGVVNGEDTEEVLEEETEEEVGISIVQITYVDSNNGMGDMIFLAAGSGKTAGTAQVQEDIKGFRVVGNQANKPINIVVQTREENNAKTIQFLNWDKRHPNQFTLNSPLGTETSLTLYQDKEQIAHYYMEDTHGDEYVQLSVNINSTLQLASGLRNK